MYIKLNFTSDKKIHHIYRVVNEIINTPAIANVASLQSTATSAGWWATLLTGFDANTSEIIRTGTGTTGLTANTVSRYARNGSGAADDQHAWTLEFSHYDDNTKKYYIQFQNATDTAGVSTVRTANGLSSGTLSSANSQLATSSSTTAGLGTAPTFNNSLASGSSGSIGSSTSGFSAVRTFFMYLSDNALVFCCTNATTYSLGFGNSYSNATGFTGPFIFSQYNRFDYTNSNATNITPLMFTNWGRGIGIGFGGVSDWDRIDNTQHNVATGNFIPFRVFNLISAYPATTASWPMILQPYVSWGIGTRYSEFTALTTVSAGSTATITNPAQGAAIFKTVHIRYPSADLKNQTFGMLPISWRHSFYNNSGGDASTQGGWYLFNGDYYPGDEFSFSGKTYKILPTWSGYAERVGIAIPKE
jgi:hypothetical protein